MTRMHKLYRHSCTTGKCEDCGLIENHSNACHDAAPIRKIEELYDQLDAANLQIRDLKEAVETAIAFIQFDQPNGKGDVGGLLSKLFKASNAVALQPKSEWAICGWCAGTGKEYGELCPKCQGAGGKDLETDSCESIYPRWNVRCCLPPGHQGQHESKRGEGRTLFMWAVEKPATQEPKKDADGRIRHCLAGKDGCTGGAMSCSCTCANCSAIRNF